MSKPWVVMYNRLIADNSVKALVVARVYPMIRPQGTALPAIEYEVTSDNPLNTASGADSTAECNISVDCIAATYMGARTLAAAVQSCLTSSADTDGNIWHLTGQSDSPGDVVPGGSVFENYIVSQDYTVWHA